MHATAMVNILCPSQRFRYVCTTEVVEQILVGGAGEWGYVMAKRTKTRGICGHAPRKFWGSFGTIYTPLTCEQLQQTEI